MLLPFCCKLCVFPTIIQLWTVPGGSIFAIKPLSFGTGGARGSSCTALTAALTVSGLVFEWLKDVPETGREGAAPRL